MKELNYKDYTVYLGTDVFESLLENLIADDYSKVFVVVDDATEKYCLPALKKYLFDIQLIKIQQGEASKNIHSAQLIWQQLIKSEADKKSVIINLGGGMIGDLGGFCAALYKRGIDYIQVPTTLLAMVDSSLGGKTAIDFADIKNSIGTIQQPKGIYINTDLLSTLPKQEWMNGYAEMLKHGLIADKKYWEKLVSTDIDDWSQLSQLILGSIKIKMDIVKKDPFEKNERKLLNFGHTIGHAIEAYSMKKDKNPLKHGEAVAIGLICEAYLSRTLLNLSNKEFKQIVDQTQKHFPKYSLRSILTPDLIKLMRQDKKNTNDEVRFTLLKKIGKGSINHSCSEAQIAAALNFYDAL